MNDSKPAILKTALTACVFISLIILSACQSSSGYNTRSWDYSAAQSAKAQQPPKPLSEIYATNKTMIQTRANADVSEEGLRTPQESSSPFTTTPQQSTPTTKVALLLPLTGQHAALGKAMLHAAQIALFDIAPTGFELAPKDTKGTPEGTRAAARAAVKDDVQLILGPVFSDNVRAAKSATRGSNINIIAFSTDWGLAGGNTFIIGFLPFDQVQRITQYAARNNLNKIGVIAPDTNYGQTVVSAYRAMTAREPLLTSEIMIFPARISNLSPTIRKFTHYDERTSKAEIAKKQGLPHDQNLETMPLPFDAVLMPVGGELAVSISNLLTHYDLDPRKVRRLGTGLFDDLAIASEDSLNGSWFAAPSPRLRKDFEARFESTYHYRAPRLSTLAYDATALAAVLAQRSSNAYNGQAFEHHAIMNPNGFSGIDGIFRFRPDGTAERGLAILEFKKGRFKIIDEAPRTFQQLTNF